MVLHTLFMVPLEPSGLKKALLEWWQRDGRLRRVGLTSVPFNQRSVTICWYSRLEAFFLFLA